MIYNKPSYLRHKLRGARTEIYGLLAARVIAIKAIEKCFPNLEKLPYVFNPETVYTPEVLNMPYYKDALHLKKETYDMPEIFTSILRDVYYCSAYNVLLNKKKVMVKESSGTMTHGKYFDWRYFHRAPKKISGCCTAFRSVSNNHYNLLIRNLPRLYALHQDEYVRLKKIKLLVVDSLNKAESYFLPKICPENIEIAYIENDCLYEIDSFVYTPFLTQKSSGYLPRSYLKFFHERVLPRKPRNKKERIFLSRGKARMRRVLNEGKLYQELKKLGFERYCLEDMSIDDQIELFYNAESVVAPHGAGLANLIFSDRIRVLEIFPFKYIKPSFFYLSKSLGHQYYYVCCNSDWLNDDFVVDVPKVVEIVRQNLT
jgi:hypothetical protein